MFFSFASCLPHWTDFLSLFFLVSSAELNLELSRPLKISPTLAKLEQAKAYVQKVLPDHVWDSSSKPSSTSCSPYSLPTKSMPRSLHTRSDPHGQSSRMGLTSNVQVLASYFHRISLHTAQIVINMETEAHPMKPSVTVSVSAMTGSLTIKPWPRTEGRSKKDDSVWHQLTNRLT